MAVGDIYEVVIVAEVGGEDVVLVMHYVTGLSVGTKESEMVGLVEGVEKAIYSGAIVETLIARTSSKYEFKEIRVRDVE